MRSAFPRVDPHKMWRIAQSMDAEQADREAARERARREARALLDAQREPEPEPIEPVELIAEAPEIEPAEPERVEAPPPAPVEIDMTESVEMAIDESDEEQEEKEEEQPKRRRPRLVPTAETPTEGDETDVLIREGEAIPDVLRDLRGLPDDAASRVLEYVIRARRLSIGGTAETSPTRSAAKAPPKRTVKAAAATPGIAAAVEAMRRIGGEVTPDMVAEELEIQQSNASYRLVQAVAQGLAVRVGRGRYALKR